MSTHTPTPWRVHDATALTIWSADGHCVADCSPNRDYANGMTASLHNAAHIVKCVNAHDALLAACKEAEPVFADAVPACIAARIPGWQKLSDVRDKLRDAVKLAEGQG